MYKQEMSSTILGILLEKKHKDQEKPLDIHTENKKDVIELQKKKPINIHKQKMRTCQFFWW